MEWVRSRTAGILACAGFAAGLLSGRTAAAVDVDGAGNVVIVPLVFSGFERSSSVTVTNAGGGPIDVTADYVGAEGTPKDAAVVGPISCGSQRLDGGQSRSFPLADWCPPLAPVDVENFGYLKLTSDGDGRISFSATSSIRTAKGTVSVIPGQPIGAFDPGRRPLSIPGAPSTLRVMGFEDMHHVACYFGSLDEPTEVELSLLDTTGQVMVSGFKLKLGAERMKRVLPFTAFGPVLDARLVVEPLSAPSLVVASCAEESPLDGTVAYLPARTPDPLDDSRLHVVLADAGVQMGPYRVGDLWTHRLVGDPASRKVTLTTYLRPDDRVYCTLRVPPYPGSFDPSPWLELQMRAPDGTVVAGGSGAKDTGVFSTGHRGRYRDERWHLDVSFDEAAGPWPGSQPKGIWAVVCESAAGMSSLLTVDDPTATDDF